MDELKKKSSHQWLDIQIRISQIESIPLSSIDDFYEIKLSHLQKLIKIECPQSEIILKKSSNLKPFATNAIEYYNIYWQDKNNPQFENINLNILLDEGGSSRSVLLSKEQVQFLEIDKHPFQLKSILHHTSVNLFVRSKNSNIKCPCDLHGCCLCIFRCNIQ
jgi:hypothetical protein